MHIQSQANHTRFNMDITDLQTYDEPEEDYHIRDFFRKELAYHLKSLVEYRIKLVLKKTTVFMLGESQLVSTACMVKSKTPKLSMHLIPYENLPLSFESGGYIDRGFTGRIMVKLTNYSIDKTRLSSGTVVGYIVMQPFSLE